MTIMYNLIMDSVVFDVIDYRTKIKCHFSQKNFLFCEGEYIDFEMNTQYIYLRFFPNKDQFCYTRHRGERVQAKIISFTNNKIIVSYKGKKKFDNLVDFVHNNKDLETCVRIERNGVGPYNSAYISSDFNNWREKQRQKENQPLPSNDHGLRRFSGVTEYCVFAFKDFKQMFNWFNLSDVLFLLKNEFNIVYKQKGLEYFESFHGKSQVAIVVDETLYDKILEKQYY